MDPGTALGVVSLVCDVAKDLYDYYKIWKNCEKDVEELRVQLIWLHKAFKTTREVVRKPDVSADGRSLVLEAIARCNDAANELRNLREKIVPKSPPETVLEKLKAQGRKACYPFRKSTVTAIVEEIDDCRQSLDLAVDLLSLDTTIEVNEKLHALDKRLVAGLGDLEDSIESVKSGIDQVQIGVNQVNETTTEIKAVTTTMQDQALFKSILDWISAKDYSPELHDNLSALTSGTGRWFLNSAEFVAWSAGSEKTLFCPGNPGTGKTMLAAAAIKHLLDTVYGCNSAVLYLFCNYKRHEEQTASHCFAALLRQMVHAKAQVPAVVHELYAHHKVRNTRPSLEELIKTITDLTTDFKTVHVVIDALDESDRNARSSLLSALRQSQSQGNVKVCATSRPLPEVVDALQADMVLNVQALDSDLALHLTSRMQELSSCALDREDLQKRIVSTIIQAAEGVFLLANLHLQSLKGKRTPNAILTALQEIPTGSEAYDSTYEKAMERIQSQRKEDSELAKDVLMWISCARTPLTSIQLRYAIAVKSTSRSLDDDDLVPIEDITSVCTGLVVQDEQGGIIRLIHYTAQEYLNRAREKWFPGAHARIARGCLWYLSLDEFRHDKHKPTSRYMSRGVVAKHPLLRYAAKHWGDHYHKSNFDENQDHTNLDNTVQGFLMNDNLVALCQCVIIFPVSPAFKGIHLSSYLGLTDMVHRMLECGYDIEADDGEQNTPLWWAAFGKRKDIVQLLLDAGADAEGGSGPDGSALAFASSSGQTDIAKLLISRGASITPENSWTSPIKEAAKHGHIDIVRMLLNEDTETSAVGDALEAAALNGHGDVVQICFDRGVSLNLLGQTLRGCVRDPFFKPAVVNTLLCHGPALDVLSQVHQFTIMGGNMEKVRSLFEDVVGADALGIATIIVSTSGQTDVLRFLLDKYQDHRGEHLHDADDETSLMNSADLMASALLIATKQSHTSIVRALLDLGVEIDANALCNGLRAGIDTGCADVIIAILEKGASANELQRATLTGKPEMVRLLLDHGASTDSEDYHKAVRHASRFRLAKILQILQMLLDAVMVADW